MLKWLATFLAEPLADLLNNFPATAVVSGDIFCPTLLILEETLTLVMDDGNSAGVVYLDFANTFGSVNHRFLLAKVVTRIKINVLQFTFTFIH